MMVLFELREISKKLSLLLEAFNSASLARLQIGEVAKLSARPKLEDFNIWEAFQEASDIYFDQRTKETVRKVIEALCWQQISNEIAAGK